MATIKFVRRQAASLTIIIAAIIGYLSLSPLQTLPAAPGSDKLHHFIAYAALCFPLLLKDAKLVRYVLPAAIAYGGLIELVQPSVNRYGEWGDFMANAMGCFLGWALAHLGQKYLA